MPVELPTPTCLPVALPLQSSHVTPISSRVSMLCDGDRVIYFPHTDPVRSHATNPSRLFLQPNHLNPMKRRNEV